MKRLSFKNLLDPELQTAVDIHANVGFAKVFAEKTTPWLPTFSTTGSLPSTVSEVLVSYWILTGNGRQYGGLKDSHAYKLFLHLKDIEHTRIRARRPQTNGSGERLDQNIKDEFYEATFRKELYRTLEEIQADFDVFMRYSDAERTNQGKYCQG